MFSIFSMLATVKVSDTYVQKVKLRNREIWQFWYDNFKWYLNGVVCIYSSLFTIHGSNKYSNNNNKYEKNWTRRALGRERMYLWQSRRLEVNKTILKPRLAAATGGQ